MDKKLTDIAIQKMARDYATAILESKFNHLKEMESFPLAQQMALLSAFHSGEDAYFWYQILDASMEKVKKLQKAPKAPSAPPNP